MQGRRRRELFPGFPEFFPPLVAASRLGYEQIGPIRAARPPHSLFRVVSIPISEVWLVGPMCG